MSMVCGLDLHRQQITFDVLDTVSGEVWRGRVWQPDRVRFRHWLRNDVARRPRAAGGDGGGGLHWLAVCGRGDHGGRVRGPCGRAGRHPGGAGPQAPRQDRSYRRPVVAGPAQRGELPESWIPPETCWSGGNESGCTSRWSINGGCGSSASTPSCSNTASPSPRARSARRRLEHGCPATTCSLTPAARQRIAVGYAMIDATDPVAAPLKKQLERFGRRQPACRALVDAHYGIGALTAVAVWAELGDCRRFSRSMQVVRHTGLDVTVDSSDRHRAGGYLSRQGPRSCAGRCSKPGMSPPATAAPTTATTRVKQRHDGKLAADLHGPQTGPPLLPHPAQHRPRRRLRHAGDLTFAGNDGRDRPPNIRVSPRSAPARALPASRRVLDGLITLRRPRSQRGSPESRLLSPTTPRSSSTEETLGAPTPPSTGP